MFRILLVDHPEGDATLLSYKEDGWMLYGPNGARGLSQLEMWFEVIDALGEEAAKAVIIELKCQEDWDYIIRGYHSRVML